MGDDFERVKKISKMIEKRTSIKNREKVYEIAQAVDKFAGFILQSYLNSKEVARK